MSDFPAINGTRQPSNRNEWQSGMDNVQYAILLYKLMHHCFSIEKGSTTPCLLELYSKHQSADA